MIEKGCHVSYWDFLCKSGYQWNTWLEMDPSFKAGSKLSLPDRAFVKLFYKNHESTSVTLQKFCMKKGLKVQKSPVSLNGILTLIWCFWGNREFGGSSMKWQVRLESGMHSCGTKCLRRFGSWYINRGVAVPMKLREEGNSGTIDSMYFAQNVGSVSVQNPGTSPVIISRYRYKTILFYKGAVRNRM